MKCGRPLGAQLRQRRRFNTEGTEDTEDTEKKMEKTWTEIRASFQISGYSVPHDVITEKIGVRPTATWIKGDRIGKSILTRKSNGWRLESRLSHLADLERHARHILKRVHPKGIKLVSIKGYKAKFSVAMYVYGSDRPPIVLPAEVIRKMAQLRASVDIDLYDLDAE
jgi:hypothetical protein